MKTITVVADDKVGLLADISYILAKSKINIDSVSVEVVAGKAIISIGVADNVKAKQVVEAAGYAVEEANSLVVKLNDDPGELSKLTDMLAKGGINLQAVHTLSKDGKHTIIALLVDKPRRAHTLLEKVLITNEETY
ncbi:MAG: ACT domain-containing protein [Candidatus Micrarchaeia archaeon]